MVMIALKKRTEAKEKGVREKMYLSLGRNVRPCLFFLCVSARTSRQETCAGEGALPPGPDEWLPASSRTTASPKALPCCMVEPEREL